MQAHDLMTTDVVTASPETPVRDIARLLLEHRISAVPVVDASGIVVGMVSEGDLIGRSEDERTARRDWWLALLAEGGQLNPDFLASLRNDSRTVRDVMTAPVIRVTAATEMAEIAAVLSQYHIKRVPVVSDGKLVGIVSRADLLRGITRNEAGRAAPEHGARSHGLITEAVASLDHRFFGNRSDAAAAQTTPPEPAGASGLDVADFRSLVSGFERHRAAAAVEARHAAEARRSEQVKQLIDEHVRDRDWNALLHQAREAAERGDREFMLLRFPSDLCTDGGRAINSALPQWPQSLRGEAAEIYVRWENELKPHGFHLVARVLDFPRGMPGDIGLFLGWGE
ncbi:MAG TPA: CBS domain-containing protein [Stellaceae bacterium]|nr:CBS domain-containing protein [Stellaceae bacterium]